MEAASGLEKVLKSGKFAVTAELGPPRNCDMQVVENKAEILKGSAHAVNITDCQTAIVRMSSISAASVLIKHGIEPVVQMTCRDRNRIAIQSDILGAAGLGVKNLLCLTGDHQKFGDHPMAKGVWDLDSVQLISMVKKMREENALNSGYDMEMTVPMFIGACENPFADPFEVRAVRLKKKIDAGAEFIQTQIVYNLEKFVKWMKEVTELGLDKQAFIMAGVTPLKSIGMARYMQTNVPGLDVPEDYIKRLKKAKEDGRNVKQEGIDIAVEIIGELRKIPGISGVHIMAIEWEEAVPEIISQAGLTI